LAFKLRTHLRLTGAQLSGGKEETAIGSGKGKWEESKVRRKEAACQVAGVSFKWGNGQYDEAEAE